MSGLNGRPRDFPGFLNPMLVKELRQGLRGRYFVSLFLILQVILLFTLSGQISSVEQGTYNAAAASALFWSLLGFPIGLLLPLSGFGALLGEKKAMTLELLQMSHLSSRGIVWGKWLAVVAQILLLVSAIFPWAVLRYLLGGVNLMQELALLGLLTAGGAALAACAVGLSAMGSRVIRGLIIVGTVFGLQIFAGVIFSITMSRMLGGSPAAGTGGPVWETPEWLMLLFQCAVVSGAALEYGASRIAPPVETHALPIRLLGWLGLLPAVAGLVMGRNSAVYFLAPGLVLLAVVSAGAVVERFRTTPGSYRGLARFGWPGRLAGLALYPGWPSGAVYAFSSAVMAWFLLGAAGLASAESGLTLVLVLGTMLVPAAIARLLLDVRRVNTEMGVLVFAILGVSAGIGIIAGILSVVGEAVTRFFCFLPPAVLLRWVTGAIDGADIGFYTTAALVSTGAAFLVLAALSLPRWSRIRQIERGLRGRAGG